MYLIAAHLRPGLVVLMVALVAVAVTASAAFAGRSVKERVGE